MNNRIWKWGILGPGKIANKFAEDLATVPNAQLYAVASRSREKAEEFATEHNAVAFYGSYEELVKDQNVDIIYISTPHIFHYEHTLLCLRNKKAVLCEKPFAMDLKQVQEMIAVAGREKVFLMEALWTHFLPHFNYLLKVVREKKYGEIKKIEADFGFAAAFLPEKRLYNKALGGGSLLDIGIYPIFMAAILLGKPEKIMANASLCKTGVDESCDIIFSYKNGAIAELSSAINKTTPTTATITFEAAIVTLINRFHEPTSIRIIIDGKEEEVTFNVSTRGYNFEAQHVQEMLSNNCIESTVMTFDKSLMLMELLDTVREKIGLKYG